MVSAVVFGRVFELAMSGPVPKPLVPTGQSPEARVE